MCIRDSGRVAEERRIEARLLLAVVAQARNQLPACRQRLVPGSFECLRGDAPVVLRVSEIQVQRRIRAAERAAVAHQPRHLIALTGPQIVNGAYADSCLLYTSPSPRDS